MLKPYRISCIIPFLNGAEYLREAIESVIRQTLDFCGHVQLILVDDGSTDASGAICREYLRTYPDNIVYTYSGSGSSCGSACGSACGSGSAANKNRGVSAARNTGLRLAAGEYVSFLDADDLIEPDYFETALRWLDGEPRIDMAAFPIRYTVYGSAEAPVVTAEADSQTAAAGRVAPVVPVEAEDLAVPVASQNFRFGKPGIVDILRDHDYIQFGVSSVVLRRKALDGLYFLETLRYSEDAEFVHRVLLKNTCYAVVKEPAYQYRVAAHNANGSGHDTANTTKGCGRNTINGCGHDMTNGCGRDMTNGHGVAAGDGGAPESATRRRHGSPDWYAMFGRFADAVVAASVERFGRVIEYSQTLLLHNTLACFAPFDTGRAPAHADIGAVKARIAESLGYVNDGVIMSYRHLDRARKGYLLRMKYGFKRAVPCVTVTIHALESLADGTVRIFGYYDLPEYGGFKLEAEAYGAARVVLGEKRVEREGYSFLGEPICAVSRFVCEAAFTDGTPAAAAVSFRIESVRVNLRLADTLTLTKSRTQPRLPRHRDIAGLTPEVEDQWLLLKKNTKKPGRRTETAAANADW